MDLIALQRRHFCLHADALRRCALVCPAPRRGVGCGPTWDGVALAVGLLGREGSNADEAVRRALARVNLPYASSRDLGGSGSPILKLKRNGSKVG